MIVYIDVLIIENFIVNLFVLNITAQTLSKKVKIPWLALGALIGSMYVICMVYPNLSFMIHLPIKIFIAFLMILIVFRDKNILFNIKAGVIFILYSMLLAGMCIFIKFSENPDISSEVIIFDFSYKKLILALMIIYVLTYRIIVYVKDRKQLQNYIYTIDIIFKKSQKTLNAFLDTGNELREIATNLPVVIVEKEFLKDIDMKDYNKFYVPYKVVNGDHGTLIGIKPECMQLHDKDTIKTKDVIIAFGETKLSKDNDYNALLSRGVFD